MDPFNIKIEIADQTVTLTILPVNSELYKIVYYGGILGAIRKEGIQSTWEAVPIEELTAGDLPNYQKSSNSDHQEVNLDASTIKQIGEAIEQTT
jgi:hypothetical protein